ncbi:MAG: hypothetical protein QXI95_02895, partial [Candidatus Micrarchaeaceae archaeon]
GLALYKRRKYLFPRMLAMLFRMKKSGSIYLFLGHIHFLKRISPTITFCGTLKPKRIIYSGRESLGYVVITHNKSFYISDPSKIALKSLA